MANEEDKFVQVTIKAQRGLSDVVRYRLMTDTDQQCWVNPGTYNTPQDLVASFEPPLCTEYQVRIIQALRDGTEEVTFSMKNVYDTL
jgi:hypothetical protein